MKYNELEKIKAYRITKKSSDGTFTPGEIIWISDGGEVNSVVIHHGILSLRDIVEEQSRLAATHSAGVSGFLFGHHSRQPKPHPSKVAVKMEVFLREDVTGT